MEDADGEQNELKTLQGQVKSLLLLNSPEISDFGSMFVNLKNLKIVTAGPDPEAGTAVVYPACRLEV